MFCIASMRSLSSSAVLLVSEQQKLVHMRHSITLDVQNTMARLSAAQVQSNPQISGPVASNRFNLSPEERTAIKQECKRLVRAAQQHFFVVLSSSALISAPAPAIRPPQQSPNRSFNGVFLFTHCTVAITVLSKAYTRFLLPL